MKLQFEDFIQQNDFPKHSLNYAKEAIGCYKVEAYRSAYIMSYLFLLNVIRYRVLENRYKPEDITDEEWDNRLDSIKDEDKWEDAVFKLIKAKTQDKELSRYFRISGKKVDDFDYWRKLRNDSVHAKDNIIDYPHVESLWLFIQSTLPRLIINGGKESVIEDIKIYFENDLINYDEKINLNLINSILNVCDEDELLSFLEKLHTELKKLPYPNYSFYKSSYVNPEIASRPYDFWRQVSITNLKNMDQKFDLLVGSNKDIFTEFIFLFPNKFGMFKKQNIIMQNFIQDYILINMAKPNANRILLDILDSDLIHEEAKEKYIKRIYDANISEKLSPQVFSILNREKYFNYVKEDLVRNTRGGGINFSVLKPSKQMDVINYFKYLTELDEKDFNFINLLNTTLKSIDSEFFIEELSIVLKGNPEIREEIVTYLEGEGVILCSVFKNIE